MKTTIKRETLEILLEVMGATLDDSTRYAFGFVQIRRLDHEKIQFDATNGHLLCQRIVEDSALSEGMLQFDRLYVGRGVLPAIKATLKEFKNIHTVMAESHAEGIDIGDTTPFTLKKDKKVQDVYPNVDTVVHGTMPDDAIEMTFDPGKLLTLAKSLGYGKRGSIAVTLRQAKSGAPIVVSYQDDKGILMPCRK